MIKLNKNNFVKKVQEVLEKYYLQPIHGTQKTNLQDGFIERQIHGAMHATRATIWSLTMHNLLQQLAPDYVNSSLKKIAAHLNTDSDTVLLLMLLTMACHDTARKGEGQDLWEIESGEIGAKVLIQLGLDENQADLFAKAISFKDKPDQYYTELKNLGIDEQDLNFFDYIRKIVNLGDNLDLMRCVNPFKSKYIFDTLDSVKGYDSNKHDKVVMEVILAIHQIIHDQHDMLFSCSVKDRGNKTVSTKPSLVSNKEKIKYEHADNVFAAIFPDVLNNPNLKAFLKTDIEIPQAKKFAGVLKFDPFIHGTNSSIFSILPKTEFKIMSPLEMIEEYQIAPLTGELTKGGYDIVGTACAKEDSIGKTSFAKMNPLDQRSYSLENVLSNYTKVSVPPKEKSLSDLKDSVAYGLSQAFTNINLILIYLARVRETHASLEEVISKQQLNELEDNLNATLQFFNFFQLIGTYIHPNFAAIAQSGMAQDILNAIYLSLTFENIVEKIKEHKIDMQEILKNPTVDNLQKALKVLELPKTYSIHTGKLIELPNTQFFSLQADYHDVKYSVFKPDFYMFSRIAQNNMRFNISSILTEFMSKSLQPEFFKLLSKKTKQHLIAFEDRLKLLHKMIEAPQNKFELNDIQRYFLKQTFPIILISDNEDNIELIDTRTHEYRSMAPLKLGKDIKTIATDTGEHRLEIMKFLELNHIYGIEVVLFDDLRASISNKEKPSEPYHHDAFPTLKWLSAQQAFRHHLLFKPSQAGAIDAGAANGQAIYSEKNTKAAAKLIEDAEKYSKINFSKKL